LAAEWSSSNHKPPSASNVIIYTCDKLKTKFKLLSAISASDMQSIGKEEGPLFGAKLAVATVRDDTASITMFNVLILGETRKSPLVRDKELLATGELVLRTAKSFQSVRTVGILCTDGEKSLADFDAGNSAKGLAERATHTGLKPIRASARKHFVNAKHMEGMGADTKMERVLACVLGQILVARHTGGLESLG
jgi:hypothetical protein